MKRDPSRFLPQTPSLSGSNIAYRPNNVQRARTSQSASRHPPTPPRSCGVLEQLRFPPPLPSPRAPGNRKIPADPQGRGGGGGSGGELVVPAALWAKNFAPGSVHQFDSLFLPTGLQKSTKTTSQNRSQSFKNPPKSMPRGNPSWTSIFGPSVIDFCGFWETRWEEKSSQEPTKID